MAMTKEESKLKQGFLQQRQNLPLEDKIRLTQRRIKSFCEFFNYEVYISFSGGKDSTVLKHIIENTEGCEHIESVFIDTGLEYPELRAFVRSQKNITIIKPKMKFNEVIEKYGFPAVSKEISKFISEYRSKPDGYTAKKFDRNSDYIKQYGTRYCLEKWIPLRDSGIKISSKCCDVMKKNPAKKFEKETGKKPIIATMACESNIRKTEYLKNGCNAFQNKRPLSTPIAFWTEQDVLQYLVEFNVPYAAVYGEIKQDSKGKYYTTGVDRTGCMFCMFGVQSEKHPNRFEKMKETHPRQYEYCINELGCAAVLDFLKVSY